MIPDGTSLFPILFAILDLMLRLTQDNWNQQGRHCGFANDAAVNEYSVLKNKHFGWVVDLKVWNI